MDLTQILVGLIGGSGLTTLGNFFVSMRRGKLEGKLTNAQIKQIAEQTGQDKYDNWQEDRAYFRTEFNKMQKEITELYVQIAELRKILIKNNIPLPD
jgi:hypothetical protein